MTQELRQSIEREVSRCYKEIVTRHPKFRSYGEVTQFFWICNLVGYAFCNIDGTPPDKFDYTQYIGDNGIILCDTYIPPKELAYAVESALKRI